MKRFFLISTLLSTGVVASLFFVQPGDAQSLNTRPPTLKLGEPLPGNLFVELAKAINPAVVNISTAATARTLRRDPYFEMLERFYGFPGQLRPDGKPTKVGLGTGFVIREDGLIVTNAHVLRGADLITVAFDESGKTYEATVVGSDDRSDIALLKIKADFKLTVASLGNSAQVQVGEWVAAFGNPFGHGHSMSKGIISSKGRSLGEINRFPLLQTDASINPGNSGGPLVNTRGEVIGVNSAIDARAQGIGFAIPIDEVKRIIPELEKSGRLRKGYLGVGLADVVSYDNQEMGGAGVRSIERAGPAYLAGIRQGDIITEYGGKKIRNSNELVDAVADTEPGKKVKVKLQRTQSARSAREMEVTVTVAERPSPERLGGGGFGSMIPRPSPGGGRTSPPSAPPTVKSEAVPYGLGFSVADPTPVILEMYEIPEGTKNPVIVDVEGGMASFVGLQPGDIILEVNRRAVRSAADVSKNLRKDQNVLKISRGSRIIVLQTEGNPRED